MKENIWAGFARLPLPRRLRVRDADGQMLGYYDKCALWDGEEPDHDRRRPGTVWVEERPTGMFGPGDPGVAAVWDGNLWFGVASVTVVTESGYAEVQVDDGDLWGGPFPSRERRRYGHPPDAVSGDARAGLACSACGAESHDAGVFEGAGCATR